MSGTFKIHNEAVASKSSLAPHPAGFLHSSSSPLAVSDLVIGYESIYQSDCCNVMLQRVEDEYMKIVTRQEAHPENLEVLTKRPRKQVPTSCR